MSSTENFTYLFDRPTEPIFKPKGDDEDVAFIVPDEYLDERYKPAASDLQTRFPGAKQIKINKINKIPDLSLPLSLDKNTPFTLFNPMHCSMSSRLITVFMETKSTDELMSLAVYCREKMNPFMFVYALSVVMLHKPETRSIQLPSHAEMFPGLYVDPTVLSRAREEAAAVPTGNRIPIEIPRDYTASDLDIEHRLQYFREDIGVNLHHWHWHLVYPFDGPRNIVEKDRRGELFYYMHQQIIARYNFERLSNRMNRVVPYTNLREPILEGYFPKLDTVVGNRVWPSRSANTRLSNLNRETDQVRFNLEDLELWRDELFKAIHSGFITDTNNQQVRLTEMEGIDILGNLIEASILSRNPNIYGSFHNNGHLAIAYSHDPDNRYLENYSVMGDSTTAMRDPVFYRWHAYINHIFTEFKAVIPRYTIQNLSFDNVRVTSVEVASGNSLARNEFATYWQQSDIDLTRGLDFVPRGSVYARFTHLQHASFTYRIVVENNGNQRVGTVRIFIAPKFDERGQPIRFNDQRQLFVELDKFSYELRRGRNEIERRSIDSSVTIPFETTYRNLNSNRPAANTASEGVFNFCGCGWPQNMLIAKGTPEGMPCELFVMVSNGANDQVENSGRGNLTCDDASSYCGVLNARYPDARSMGYPFDRPGREGVVSLRQFLTPNMIVQDVIIRFSNRVVAPRAQSSDNQARPSSGSGNRRQ
ncbi:phenoloxidase 2-like isoform X1 [Daktulosphaira vitifoliae]|uniref:phenoloxidase 2-like isoform X1 n=1 Tax=Daktulosphaira vitifoliae TaxID=58002 RepID=UPI0021AAB146|nr:phenoloxidase 2-like isoform X1 [Daktulosphaira vitifoliae]